MSCFRLFHIIYVQRRIHMIHTNDIKYIDPQEIAKTPVCDSVTKMKLCAIEQDMRHKLTNGVSDYSATDPEILPTSFFNCFSYELK